MKVPRYSGFKPASAAASQIKRRVRNRDTQAELLLRRELWGRGFRYRVHSDKVPGRPDIIFGRARVAVFCDGDFWHGRNWRRRKALLEGGANSDYWLAKIGSNIRRDKRITAQLRKNGWIVVRLWETDILADPVAAASRVAAIIDSRKHL